jgi:hypothetical protein
MFAHMSRTRVVAASLGSTIKTKKTALVPEEASAETWGCAIVGGRSYRPSGAMQCSEGTVRTCNFGRARKSCVQFPRGPEIDGVDVICKDIAAMKSLLCGG